MAKSEQTQAAEALIQWFNSQEISASDAKAVMAKVLVKIMIKSNSDTIEMRKIFDAFIVDLANEANQRAFNVVHRKGKDS